MACHTQVVSIGAKVAFEEAYRRCHCQSTRYDYTNAITIGTIISGVLVISKSKLILQTAKVIQCIECIELSGLC